MNLKLFYQFGQSRLTRPAHEIQAGRPTQTQFYQDAWSLLMFENTLSPWILDQVQVTKNRAEA